MMTTAAIEEQTLIEQLMANSDDAAVLLKAMSHKSRLMIMCSLYTDELSVGELNKIIPISQSALSQHLAALRQAGLVSTRRASQTIYYRISSDACAAVIHALKEHYCELSDS